MSDEDRERSPDGPADRPDPPPPTDRSTFGRRASDSVDPKPAVDGLGTMPSGALAESNRIREYLGFLCFAGAVFLVLFVFFVANQVLHEDLTKLDVRLLETSGFGYVVAARGAVIAALLTTAFGLAKLGRDLVQPLQVHVAARARDSEVSESAVMALLAGVIGGKLGGKAADDE